ncbi:MAG TPA: DUF6152 family protein [Candidatus Acidoferrales bacterium]|jgi:hypothetical protein|nr:DUF6152 family protein [Candidatus Acidoferrales bacterium]
MKSKRVVSSGVLAGIFAISTLLFAHHGGSEYDTKNLKTLKGAVTEYYWANPHCQIFLDVKDDSGKTVNWGIETLAPAVLRRAGWNPQLLKPGDLVTLVVAPSKKGTPIGMIRKLILPDGKELTGGELGEQPPQKSSN